MSNYKLLYPSNRTCRSETEIGNLFERHVRSLVDEKQRIINELLEWESNLVRQIQEHVYQQKTLLEEQWKQQIDLLKTKRQEYLDTALIYEQRRDREEVRQLLEQCHALKVQLGGLEYPEQPIPFVQIQKATQPSDDANQLEKTSRINEDTRNEYTSTYASSHQIHQQLTPIISNDDSFNSNVTYNDDMVDKCPACLMIFPRTMGTNERSEHVNRHFGDP